MFLLSAPFAARFPFADSSPRARYCSFLLEHSPSYLCTQLPTGAGLLLYPYQSISPGAARTALSNWLLLNSQMGVSFSSAAKLRVINSTSLEKADGEANVCWHLSLLLEDQADWVWLRSLLAFQCFSCWSAARSGCLSGDSISVGPVLQVPLWNGNWIAHDILITIDAC